MILEQVWGGVVERGLLMNYDDAAEAMGGAGRACYCQRAQYAHARGRAVPAGPKLLTA